MPFEQRLREHNPSLPPHIRNRPTNICEEQEIARKRDRSRPSPLSPGTTVISTEAQRSGETPIFVQPTNAGYPILSAASSRITRVPASFAGGLVRWEIARKPDRSRPSPLPQVPTSSRPKRSEVERPLYLCSPTNGMPHLQRSFLAHNRGGQVGRRAERSRSDLPSQKSFHPERRIPQSKAVPANSLAERSAKKRKPAP